MSGGQHYFWLGASADADRAGGPADLSRDASQPKALIPRATIDRFWAACLKHEKTIQIDALFDLLAALGLRLTIVGKGDK